MAQWLFGCFVAMPIEDGIQTGMLDKHSNTEPPAPGTAFYLWLTEYLYLPNSISASHFHFERPVFAILIEEGH